MAELKARMPCEGLLPLTFGGVNLDEADLGVMTSVVLLGEEAMWSRCWNGLSPSTCAGCISSVATPRARKWGICRRPLRAPGRGRF